MKKLPSFLPALYAEAVHLCVGTAHKFAHGMWEHMVIMCVLEKLAHAAGLEEARLLGLVTEYLVPVGMISSIGYAGIKLMRKIAPESLDGESL